MNKIKNTTNVTMSVIKMIWARTIAMEDSGSSRNVSPGLNVEIVFYAYQRKKNRVIYTLMQYLL